jgi:hypothetical protein
MNKEVSAGTEPVATSPETDSQTRFLAKSFHPLYQEPRVRARSNLRFSTTCFLCASAEIAGSSVSMLCKNQDREKL